MDILSPSSSEVTEEITQTIQTITSMDAGSFLTAARDFIVDSLPRFTTALILFIAGYFLIRLLMRLSKQVLSRSKVDAALSHFTLSALRISLYILLAVIVLSVLLPGAVSGIITALGIFGLAISLAVKDSLSNLAGGIMVLFTKPFGLGDYVTIDALDGTVQEIRLNYTVLSTVDNKTIHIPNGDVAKAKITNFTCQELRRLDVNFSISYHDDFEQAKQIILELLRQHPSSIREPEPVVRVVELGTSSVVICCRVWVTTADYWPLRFDLLEQVKLAFDQANITIPYSQLEVTLKEQP